MRLIRYDYPTLPSARDFDRMLGEFWATFPRFENAFTEPQARVSTDIYEDAANVYARFELPGFKKEELGVQLENSVLTVSVERKGEKDEDESLSLTRSVTIPDGIDATKVSAKYEDGVLTVTLPKTPERKPKAIEIQ